MPEITATRPTSGAPIETAWGTQAHDALNRDNIIVLAEFTANVTISATTEAAANVIVTAPAVTVAAGDVLLIEFSSIYLQATTNASSLQLYLFEDGVSLGRLSTTVASAVANLSVPGYLRTRHAPAAGSHVYSIRGSTSASATGLVSAGPGGVGQVRPGLLTVRYCA